MSSILNVASSVLYGSPPGPKTANTNGGRENQTTTSTPKPSAVNDDGNADFKLLVMENSRKLDTVLSKLSKLEDIESTLVSIDTEIAVLKGRVTTVEKESTEFARSLNFMSDTVTELKTTVENGAVNRIDDRKLQKLNEEMSRHKSMIESLSRRIENVNREKREMKEKITDLQWRSMKNNLVFTGLKGETNYEDCEEKLRDFLYNELEIDDHIAFGNVHRFGKFVRGRSRPIVARFMYSRDRAMVKELSYKLRGTQFAIHEQLPRDMEDRRRQLLPVMHRFRDSGAHARMVRDKLFVNGRLYREESEEDNADLFEDANDVMETESPNPNVASEGDTEGDVSRSDIR
ncbi:hypothetical protein FSP39_023172 [Pinctada imbricata]|uniref:Uncharacterized protein n=1 Tax=Pinctada imbricata TaxID=66713 RepID=A0AA89BSK5_PINIB|nr:hypothetical protein FSP39_023172 [Pinctada imbricata]